MAMGTFDVHRDEINVSAMHSNLCVGHAEEANNFSMLRKSLMCIVQSFRRAVESQDE